MSAIGSPGNKRPGLDRTKAIASEVLADLVIAQWLAPVAQLFDDPPYSIAAPVFPENQYDLFFTIFFFGFRLIGLPGFPGVIAASFDL